MTNTDERGSDVGLLDVGTGVSQHLYENKLEIAMLSPIRINRDERCWLRWYMPDDVQGKKTYAFIQFVGKCASLNYTTVQSTALPKGLSMLQHTFGSSLYTLEEWEESALFDGNSVYYRKRGAYSIMITFPNNERKVITDETTQGLITKYSELLNMPIQQFTTVLILYALVDSDTIPGYLRQMFQKYLDEFEDKIKAYFEFMGIEQTQTQEQEPGGDV